MPKTIPPPRGRAGTYTAVFSTLLAGLAAGALWCLLSLAFEGGTAALIVPLAFAVGAYFRWLGIDGMRGIVCGVIALLIAFVYAQYLFAAVRVAQMLGFPLRSTLFKMDLGLAWQVTRGALGAMDFVWLALACVVTATIALRRPQSW